MKDFCLHKQVNSTTILVEVGHQAGYEAKLIITEVDVNQQ